jgi:hypothetical protein
MTDASKVDDSANHAHLQSTEAVGNRTYLKRPQWGSIAAEDAIQQVLAEQVGCRTV